MSDQQVDAYLLEEWKHESWAYWGDDIPRCMCGHKLEDGPRGPIQSLDRHRVTVSLEAAGLAR